MARLTSQLALYFHLAHDLTRLVVRRFGSSITPPIDDVLMQVIVLPTHRYLQNEMELLERCLAGELNAPPYCWFDFPERHMHSV